MTRPIIESVHEISDTALKEIKDWLDPWFLGRASLPLRPAKPAPGGSGLMFATYPQAGTWFYASTSDGSASPNGYGLEWDDTSSEGITWLTGGASAGSLGTWGQALIDASGNGIIIAEFDSGLLYVTTDFAAMSAGASPSSLLFHLDASVSPKKATLELPSGAEFVVEDHTTAAIASFTDGSPNGIKFFAPLDMDSLNIVNLADGVNPQDAATVAQLSSGSAITLVESSDGSVGVSGGTGPTVDLSLAAAVGTAGFSLHDTSAAAGIGLFSDSSSIVLEADAGSVYLASGSTFFSIDPTFGSYVALPGAGTFIVYNSLDLPILTVDEATGVTSGTFDGGGA